MAIQFRCKISTKGLLIVAMPLLTQAILVSIMWALQEHAQRQVEAAALSRQVVQECNTITRITYQMGVVTMLLQVMDTDALLNKLAAMEKELQAHMHELQVLVQKNPAQLSRISTLREQLSLLLEYLERFAVCVKRRDSAEALALAPKLRRAIVIIIGKADAIMQEVESAEKLQQDTRTLPEQAAIVMQKQWLLIIVLVNAALCLVLGAFFAKSITSRLQILSSNSRRLACGEELIPPMVGKDEIAELDQTFHEMAQALRQANLAKRQFMSMIVHDLRSPLTSIHGFFQLAEKGVFGAINDAMLHRVRSLKGATARLNQLIDELLDQDKAESGLVSGDRFDVDVGVVIDTAISMVEFMAAERGIELVCTDLPEVTIKGDENRLIQVFQNLLSNAVKYSQQGSRVVISTHKAEERLAVDVSDQGIGIEESQLEKIFERYVQVEDSEGIHLLGSGLGLWVCREIVRQHGGEISVVSTPGKGTTFTVSLPLQSEALVADSQGDQPRAWLKSWLSKTTTK